MSTVKSLTGRTVVETTVEERGAVSVTVRRGGIVVNSFTIGDEPDLPKAPGTRVQLSADKKSVEVFVDGKLHEAIAVS